MSIDAAMRLTEIFLALALIHQSLEHVWAARGVRYDTVLFLARIGGCVLLLLALHRPLSLLVLCALSLMILNRFQGPYNGGSDRMGLLALWCLMAAHLSPWPVVSELFFGYLALQLVLSYVVSGFVKIVNPDWRAGRALRDVFLFSVYPVSVSLRTLAGHPRLLTVAAWAVMVFELLFPLVMYSPATLSVGLVLAGSFHLMNAVVFGLNRFFWTWLAVFPSLIWIQARL